MASEKEICWTLVDEDAHDKLLAYSAGDSMIAPAIQHMVHRAGVYDVSLAGTMAFDIGERHYTIDIPASDEVGGWVSELTAGLISAFYVFGMVGLYIVRGKDGRARIFIKPPGEGFFAMKNTSPPKYGWFPRSQRSSVKFQQAFEEITDANIDRSVFVYVWPGSAPVACNKQPMFNSPLSSLVPDIAFYNALQNMHLSASARRADPLLVHVTSAQQRGSVPLGADTVGALASTFVAPFATDPEKPSIEPLQDPVPERRITDLAVRPANPYGRREATPAQKLRMHDIDLGLKVNGGHMGYIVPPSDPAGIENVGGALNDKIWAAITRTRPGARTSVSRVVEVEAGEMDIVYAVNELRRMANMAVRSFAEAAPQTVLADGAEGGDDRRAMVSDVDLRDLEPEASRQQRREDRRLALTDEVRAMRHAMAAELLRTKGDTTEDGVRITVGDALKYYDDHFGTVEAEVAARLEVETREEADDKAPARATLELKWNSGAKIMPSGLKNIFETVRIAKEMGLNEAAVEIMATYAIKGAEEAGIPLPGTEAEAEAGAGVAIAAPPKRARIDYDPDL